MTFRLRPDGRLHYSENDVRRACLDALRYRGWWPIRQHVGLFKIGDDWVKIGEAGDPDYAVIRPPSFFLETKRPGAKLSAVQQKRIAALDELCGVKTVVISSVEELVDWLDGHDPLVLVDPRQRGP
jgi:hypothetical protein